MGYSKHFSTRKTSQTSPIPGKTMIENSEGGYTFQVDCWIALNRFLILGSEGGSYYIDEKQLTVENCTSILACIAEDADRTVDAIVDVSTNNRAPKNDAALFALAICSGDSRTQARAFAALPQVARIGTHLLQFVSYMEAFRGWGRAARRGVGAWFHQKDVDWLALQHIKFNSRYGWALRDVLRVCHASTLDTDRNRMFKYIASGADAVDNELLPAQAQAVIEIEAEAGADVKRIIELIHEHGLVSAAGIKHLSMPDGFEPSKFTISGSLLTDNPTTSAHGKQNEPGQVCVDGVYQQDNP